MLLFLSVSSFNITKKYCDGKLFCNAIPVICNFLPPDNEALLNQLYVINCIDDLQILEEHLISEGSTIDVVIDNGLKEAYQEKIQT